MQHLLFYYHAGNLASSVFPSLASRKKVAQLISCKLRIGTSSHGPSQDLQESISSIRAFKEKFVYAKWLLHPSRLFAGSRSDPVTSFLCAALQHSLLNLLP